MITEVQKAAFYKFIQNLQDRIIASVENLEQKYSVKNSHSQFTKTAWQREGGGGGTIGLIRGEVFEKMGVNVSCVFGEAPEIISKEFDDAKTFWASGISLVSHPKNPHISPIHMNLRLFATEKSWWFGGCIDLNPILYNKKEKEEFHKDLQNICARYNPDYYRDFSKQCDEYFLIKHRNEPRGVGGIFFDRLWGDFDNLFSFVAEIGDYFTVLCNRIVDENQNKTITESDKKNQLHKRARYVEFNLIYDRGIKFGLATGGNPDGMFMSLPPLAAWE